MNKQSFECALLGIAEFLLSIAVMSFFIWAGYMVLFYRVFEHAPVISYMDMVFLHAGIRSAVHSAKHIK